MATKKKMLQAAAGQAGGEALDITEVFSTYLYTGDGGTGVVVDNGIDLAGEGGLVWIKARNAAEDHVLFDTERGVTKLLESNTTLAEQTNSGTLTNFYSDGFRVDGNGTVGSSLDPYVSWTFRKAPKFFDVVTYTGDGNASRAIAHSLESAPGFIMVKRTDSADDWVCYHKNILGADNVNAWQYTLTLNGTNAKYHAEGGQGAAWGGQNPDDTNFYVDDFLSKMNESGATYVAYLFAHNDGDGGFGPDNSDIIKCGSYTGNASNSAGPIIDLGFEPQWVMIKSVDSAYDWFMADTMRGWTATHPDDDNLLRANTSGAETANTEIGLVNSTGFQIMGGGAEINGNGQTYIYMAIRRGPLAQPESGTEVFAQDFVFSSEANAAGVQYYSGFPVDMSLFSGSRSVGGNHDVRSRLTGDKRMFSNATDAETSAGTPWWDTNEGWKPSTGGTLSTDSVTWMWKRAPGFCDVVAWKVDGSGDQTINHNLGVIPEMVISKNRNTTSSTYNWWVVAHKDLTGWDSANENDRHVLRLDSSAASAQQGYHRDFTDTSIRMLGVASGGYTTTDNVIAYLFGTVPGVSKVGSFTGNGTSQDINCGFTSGARFVLLKRTDSSGTWFILDSERGIVAGNDAILRPNTATAEDNNYDIIDPLSSGFTINYVSAYNMNASGATYIFYAIA